MVVRIFQFNGCNKCFNETILLKRESKYKVEFIQNPQNWKEEKTDLSIITGIGTIGEIFMPNTPS